MVDLKALSEAMQSGRAKDVRVLVQAAIDEGIPASRILDEALLSGMDAVGVKFKNNEIFVPEVLVAARAMNAGMEILQPLLVQTGVQSKGTVILGTVKGDLHDIGKNLVGMMMKGKGLSVIDLGTDVQTDRFIEEAIKHDADIIACSALLTTTMREMEHVVNAVKEANLRNRVTIMVGGAPVTEAFKSSIGADIYTPDAASASEAAYKVCTERRKA
ncbi:MAG TPA: corrinoid protein [Sphaerochaeta sp.]|jgi:corrinoid protein of di/trimethylamine methyltransferase|nr:cobalamin-binding protein [Spirochaetales bacterium]HPX28159.1 corrinoid protein [Sphaerochaeta sp.]HQB54167.1 corrinoid protein [Sphaerochaeta sp.]